MKRKLILAVLALAAFPVYGQSTLDAVKGKGFVQCGVNTGLAGFSQPDSKGVWKGLDVDLCRAVAAAVELEALVDQRDVVGDRVAVAGKDDLGGHLHAFVVEPALHGFDHVMGRDRDVHLAGVGPEPQAQLDHLRRERVGGHHRSGFGFDVWHRPRRLHHRPFERLSCGKLFLLRPLR